MPCCFDSNLVAVTAPCGRTYTVCLNCDAGINDCTEGECDHLKTGTEWNEGDEALLAVMISRVNSEQALIEFYSMEGPFSVRVPISELRSQS